MLNAKVLTREDVNNTVRDLTAKLLALSNTKGVEYCHGSDNAWHNFEEIARFAGLAPEQVWLVYAAKHFQAVANHVRSGKVLSEPVEGRLHDLAMYLVLYLARQRAKEEAKGEVKGDGIVDYAKRLEAVLDTLKPIAKVQDAIQPDALTSHPYCSSCQGEIRTDPDYRTINGIRYALHKNCVGRWEEFSSVALQAKQDMLAGIVGHGAG